MSPKLADFVDWVCPSFPDLPFDVRAWLWLMRKMVCRAVGHKAFAVGPYRPGTVCICERCQALGKIRHRVVQDDQNKDEGF